MIPAFSISPTPLLVTLALVGSSASASAQATAVASRPSHAAQLKGALRAVAAAQSRHHAATASYAASLDVLRVPPAPGMRIEILAAGPFWWKARARHQEQLGRSCVIFVGRLEDNEAPRTDADREMAGEEGVPLCDRMR